MPPTSVLVVDDSALMRRALKGILAEAGDFAGAVEWQRRALADAGHVKEAGEAVRQRLDLYAAKTAFRDRRPEAGGR